MEILDNIFLNYKDKFQKGLANELAICGNIHQLGYDTKVLNDHNPNYDISIIKDGKQNYIECKLDTRSDTTHNLYFEVWNYTYNRKCGITNDNMLSLYCHTFRKDGVWYYIINYRKTFVNIIKTILKEFPDKIRQYNNTYFINGQLVGDKAYIVDMGTFLSLYTAKVHTMNISFKW